MLIDTLIELPWLVAVLWGGLSIVDFVATMLYSKAYREFLGATVQYEHGVEMNPSFEKDVRELRWFSSRYILSMLSVVLLLGLAGTWLPAAWFEALAGSALLLVLITDLRYFIIFLLTGHVFFAGGAFISILFAARHFLLSRRKLPAQSIVN